MTRVVDQSGMSGCYVLDAIAEQRKRRLSHGPLRQLASTLDRASMILDGIVSTKQTLYLLLIEKS